MTIIESKYESKYESNYDYNDTSLSKNSKTSKCSPDKKCPCRLWINCNQYVDIEEKERRLKYKTLRSENDNIHTWYKENFRLIYDMPTSIPNG